MRKERKKRDKRRKVGSEERKRAASEADRGKEMKSNVGGVPEEV